MGGIFATYRQFSDISTDSSLGFRCVYRKMTPPLSFNDGMFAPRTASPVMSWTQDIWNYQIAVGTTAGATNIATWTNVGNVGSAMISNLSLVQGMTYYGSVRAVGSLNDVSVPVLGDGFVVSMYDVNANQRSLMITADGASGANNNTFLDSSSNNLMIARNGTPTQGTFSPFSAEVSKWSSYFNGMSDFFSIAGNNVFNFGSNNWTAEAWVYLNTLPTSDAWPTNWSQHMVIAGTGTPSATDGIDLIIGQTKLMIHSNDVQYAGTAHGMVPNQWYHVAYIRSGNTINFYVNGQPKGSASFSGSVGTGATTFIGSETGQGAYFNGYISNLRVVQNNALYTSTFTPSITPVTAVTGTSLLTCQNNRFKDNSTNNFALTTAGAPKAVAISPFLPSIVNYSPADHGGSAYFNGTSDYLTMPGSANLAFGTGDFTIETWVYANDATSSWPINNVYWSSGYQGGWAFSVTGNSFSFFRANASILSVTALQVRAWNHIAVVRSGGVSTLYINGEYKSSVNDPYDYTVPSVNVLKVGGAILDGSFTSKFNGYVSNTRIVKGSAVYAGNFTPPFRLLSTSGVASSTGYLSQSNINTTFAASQTSVLLNFTNAGIIDGTKKNNLTTLGDTKILTSDQKSGTGSLYLDGAGDYATMPHSQFPSILTGDFTIETWVKPTGTGFRVILGQWTQEVLGFEGFLLGTLNNNFVYYFGAANNSSPLLTSSTTFSPNNWYHLAVVRSGSTFTMYVNGASVATATSTATRAPLSVKYTLGNYYNSSGVLGADGATDFAGYIDNLTLISGKSIYNGTFTPSTDSLGY